MLIIEKYWTWSFHTQGIIDLRWQELKQNKENERTGESTERQLAKILKKPKLTFQNNFLKNSTKYAHLSTETLTTIKQDP